MDNQRLHSFTYLKNIDYFTKLFNPKLIKKILDQQFLNELIPPSDDKLQDVLNYEATLVAPNFNNIKDCQTAFGRLEIPELRKKLLHHDLNISRQALVSLLDIVHDPEKAVEIIRLNVLARIVRLMVSEDTYTRQHALCFLRVLAGQPNGPLAIVRKKYILDNLKTALYDKHYFVRFQASLTCILLCRSWFAFNTLIKNCFVLHLMGRICFEERVEILGSLLTALEHILDKSNRAKIEAIENHVCENLAEYLQHNDDFVRSEAHGVLIQVFTIPEGKTAAENCYIDIFSFLKKSLKDKDEEVMERAALALAFLFVTTPGKKRGVELNIMNDLLPLAFYTNNPRIIKNVLQALTNLAAAHSVKEELLQYHLTSILKINNQNNSELKNFIQRLVTVVTHVI